MKMKKIKSNVAETSSFPKSSRVETIGCLIKSNAKSHRAMLSHRQPEAIFASHDSETMSPPPRHFSTTLVIIQDSTIIQILGSVITLEESNDDSSLRDLRIESNDARRDKCDVTSI